MGQPVDPGQPVGHPEGQPVGQPVGHPKDHLRGQPVGHPKDHLRGQPVGYPAGQSVAQDQQADQDQQCAQVGQHSVYRRVFSAVQRMWTGVKFALDSELDDLDSVQTHRPSSLAALVRATRFTEAELKRIYRGFKAECPSGLVKEDAFKLIYQQFFPQGANAGQYAHYVFRTLDQDHVGLINFENFVHGLSVLSRGSVDERLRWAFSLYDVNGDGRITKDELADVASSVYEMMGKLATSDQHALHCKVDRVFQKLDLNGDGVITLEEFLDACLRDEQIRRSMAALDSCF